MAGRTRLLFLGLLLTGLGIKSQAQRGKQPNIVVIMADDLDSRQLSCYGGRNLKTTNIDRLADQGMQFNNMIASEAMCVPTRASLFTGLYPVRHGSYQNHKPVYDTLKSIGHYLSGLGYTVALTGKDHSTKPRTVFPFEIIKGFEPNCVSPTDDYSLTDVKAFMSGQQKPFCLFVMSINPHAPWTMGDTTEFDPEQLILPPHWVDTKSTRQQFRKYLAEVRRLDNQVGELMQAVKETGKEDNTVFIFLGEQGAQFPGAKWTLWDAGQKSSMIVRWPGVVQPKSATGAIVQYEDITPTFINIAGGSPVAQLDGRSFLEVLQGKTQQAREVAFGIHNNLPEGPPYPIRSIRDGRYKLLLNLTPGKNYHIKYMMNPKNAYWVSWKEKAKTSPNDKLLVERNIHRPAVEFYDLEKDPYELHNLAGDKKYAAQIAAYRQKLEGWMHQQGDPGATLDIPFERR
ncbi:sulfatase family protein [Niabella drilacis]|uniref:Sulfatase n=1 Tax=Niabella drilacis (strain DSM 25811 / CCM 8410 / CCUG 62505 / LMG 26954 / E90) TaxID=1285928 RepID=A0A1G6ZRM3_NIADE|nr:sulfatase [Niabella drilacis]SDE04867.1 Sulfatase [Niabella drilacis]